MKLLPTCRLCNFTSFHCLTAFSFPFTKNGKFDKLVEFVSSFPRWELERVSATDILFLPPFPSLGKHAPRARSDREGRSPEMGRRKKRKSQEGASLTTLLYSPLPISLPIELLCLLSIRRFFWDPSSGKEKPIFVVRFDSAFPSAFLSKRNFWLFRQDQEKSATAAVSYPKPLCRLLPSLCVSHDCNNRGHKTGGGYRESTKPKNRTLAPSFRPSSLRRQ